jgi:hypothetical protein
VEIEWALEISAHQAVGGRVKMGWVEGMVGQALVDLRQVSEIKEMPAGGFP